MSDVSQQLYDETYLRSLHKRADEKAREYQTNQPYPHIVLDDFLPPSVAESVLSSFPGPRDLPWINFNDPRQIKLAFNRAAEVPDPIREVLFFLNSAPLLEFLERLTGIDDVIGDPHYSGGGLHQIKRGGHLDVHADFNKHDRFDLDRRLNLLIYLNKDWQEDYGGHFELWNRDMTACARKVLPVFNRCAIFSTTDYSFHGHPDPLNCPPDRTRRSLATYYYTNGRPAEEESEGHSTLFRARPGEDHNGKSSVTLKGVVRSLVPPIVTDSYRALRERRTSGNN